ncbi:MAG TPA: hypothetical protein VEC19_07990 [Usitatibacter sp.]|nr:hypothetical protein [Usitatibacter sp.]
MHDMLTPLLGGLLLTSMALVLLYPVAESLVADGVLSDRVCEARVHLLAATICATLGLVGAGAATHTAYWPSSTVGTCAWLLAWTVLAVIEAALIADYGVACHTSWRVGWGLLALAPLGIGALLAGEAVKVARRGRQASP